MIIINGNFSLLGDLLINNAIASTPINIVTDRFIAEEEIVVMVSYKKYDQIYKVIHDKLTPKITTEEEL